MPLKLEARLQTLYARCSKSWNGDCSDNILFFESCQLKQCLIELLRLLQSTQKAALGMDRSKQKSFSSCCCQRHVGRATSPIWPSPARKGWLTKLFMDRDDMVLTLSRLREQCLLELCYQYPHSYWPADVVAA
jgi:hypothetical protein